MTEIDVEIRNLEETQAALEQLVADLRGPPFLGAMRRATLIVQREAKKKAPVDTGRLRASITPEIRFEGDNPIGVIGSNVRYAPFRELGTRPHFVPEKYIGVWKSRHGFPPGGGLFVTGRATPFLEPALTENAEKVLRLLDEAIASIIREAGDG